MIRSEDLSILLPGPTEPRDSWRWATVTGVSPLRVRLDGDTAALDVTPDTLVVGALVVGRRVWVQITGRQIVVHGAAGALTAAQARGAAGVTIGPIASPSGTVLTNVFPAVPFKTRVFWRANGHAGYPPGTVGLYLEATFPGGTETSTSWPQDMAVTTAAWISVSEGGSFTIPASTAVTLTLTGYVSATYAYWRFNFDWARSYEP